MMAKVYSSVYSYQAEFVQMLLRKHGIQSALENAETAHVMGSPSILAPVFLLVDQSDAEQALAVIRREAGPPASQK